MFERYRTKHDYIEVHRKSPLFLEFREILNGLKPTITGESAIESGIGYV